MNFNMTSLIAATAVCVLTGCGTIPTIRGHKTTSAVLEQSPDAMSKMWATYNAAIAKPVPTNTADAGTEAYTEYLRDDFGPWMREQNAAIREINVLSDELANPNGKTAKFKYILFKHILVIELLENKRVAAAALPMNPPPGTKSSSAFYATDPTLTSIQNWEGSAGSCVGGVRSLGVEYDYWETRCVALLESFLEWRSTIPERAIYQFEIKPHKVRFRSKIDTEEDEILSGLDPKEGQ